MRQLRLLQRREIWLPTMLGWLLLFSFAGVLSLLVALNIHRYLAPNAPVPGARLFIVEGWLSPKELDQALARFNAGHYEMIVTTGGPIERWQELIGISNYADLAARYLRQQGLGAAELVSIPSPASAQDRTYLSAVSVRLWTDKNHGSISKVDVFSSGVHARRSQLLYGLALGEKAQIGVLSAIPTEYEPERWWHSSVGVKAILGEVVGLAWTICCFRPGPHGSHAELWGNYDGR